MARLPLIPGHARLRQRSAIVISTMQWPMLLTLDRKNHRGKLTIARLRNTMRAFARLRRTKPFRPVRGGVAAIDISNNGNGWHDHIHAIIDAQWLDLPALTKAWQRAVKGKGRVHVQRLHHPRKALDYITKPPEANGAPDVAEAMRAPYLTTAWGTCGPSRRPQSPKP